MTFQDTLSELSMQTERTTIYALLSYHGSQLAMGFRREWYGADLKDPVIDGTVFMLCADAWQRILECPITRTDDLMCNPQDEIEIRLRAVGGWPTATIDLGEYAILDMNVEQYEDVYFLSGPRKIPSAIRLEIERI